MRFGRKLALGMAATLVLFAIAEAALRVLGVGTLAASSDPYLGFFNDVPLFVTGTDAGGAPAYVMNKARSAKFFPATFPVHKSAATVRIFCLGGSAAQGWPHEPRFAYPTYLEQLLAASYPDRRFEVINLGGHTYATYRILNVLAEVLHYDPDLVIMYEGNNEFLEKRYYRDPLADAPLQHVNAWLNHMRVYGAWKAFLNRVLGPAKREGITSYNPLSGDAGREHRRQFALKETLPLRYDPVQFERLKEHYAYNLEEMARLCRERGVPFVLLTVPVNLADWPPNHSLHSSACGAGQQAEFDQVLEAGRQALDRGDADAAMKLLDRACELDAQFAEAHYLRGLARSRLGDCPGARADLQAAVDLDQLPFRALSTFNDVIRSLGERRAARVLDMAAIFAQHSACGCPGRGLFVDYVHPTMQGNELIAREVLPVIVASGVCGSAPPAEVGGVSLASDPSYYHSDEKFLRMMGFLHLEFGHYPAALQDYSLLSELELADANERPMLGFCRDQIARYLQRESLPESERGVLESEFRSFLEAVVFGTEDFRKRYFGERLKAREQVAH